MKKTNCLFCGFKRERAKEHIWPKWLQTIINSDMYGQFSGAHLNFSLDTLDKRLQNGESLVCGKICKNCNIGWMRQLELNFQAIFNKKMNSEVIVFDENTSRIVSYWAFKTSLMINAGSNFRKIIPNSHFLCLYNNSIPCNVKIYIAISTLDKSLKWLQSQTATYIQKHDKKFNDDYYSISMQISDIIIKIVNLPNKDSNIVDPNNEYRQIWPYVNNFTSSDISKPINFIHSDLNIIEI